MLGNQAFCAIIWFISNFDDGSTTHIFILSFEVNIDGIVCEQPNFHHPTYRVQRYTSVFGWFWAKS